MHTNWCVLIEISMEIGMLNFWLGLLVTALMKETYFSEYAIWKQRSVKVDPGWASVKAIAQISARDHVHSLTSRLLYFWPRFYIVVLGMTFFYVTSTFSIFFLDFYFLFLFGLLFPFSLWTFILFRFVLNSFSICFKFVLNSL